MLGSLLLSHGRLIGREISRSAGLRSNPSLAKRTAKLWPGLCGLSCLITQLLHLRLGGINSEAGQMGNTIKIPHVGLQSEWQSDHLSLLLGSVCPH